MPRGGKRQNAGRKAGVPSTKTVARREIADKAAAQGVTPLEVLLDNMRFYHDKAAETLAAYALDGVPALPEDPENPKESPDDRRRREVVSAIKEICGLRKMAGEAAGQAAPYIHPRRSPIDENAKRSDGVPLQERLKHYQTRDAAVAANPGKVVALKPAKKR